MKGRRRSAWFGACVGLIVALGLDSDQIVTGTFKPTNFFDFGEGGDSFPAPAPAPSGASTLATFTGTDPNGTWSLYVVDDTEFDVGSIAGGWCVTVTTAAVPVFDFAGFFPRWTTSPPLTRSTPGATFR